MSDTDRHDGEQKSDTNTAMADPRTGYQIKIEVVTFNNDGQKESSFVTRGSIPAEANANRLLVSTIESMASEMFLPDGYTENSYDEPEEQFRDPVAEGIVTQEGVEFPSIADWAEKKRLAMEIFRALQPLVDIIVNHDQEK